MRVSNNIAACIALFCLQGALADTPPPQMHLVPGPAGTEVPYFNDYAYAYIGKVIGYSENQWKHPALDVLVLDAWTPKQKDGDILKVTVQPWSAAEHGDFDPSRYPIGTRLRVITFGKEISNWDADIALVVLGVGP
jgi:hypothetical protein